MKPQVEGEPAYRVVVLELEDVAPRVLDDRPNLYVGVSARPADDLAAGLNEGRFKPAWARHRVVTTRQDLTVQGMFTHELAREHRDDLIRTLRSKGFRVNRIGRAYRTYVINLHNPGLNDPGLGYVYVGQTSKTPEQRLREHLTGAVSNKGHNLASRKVRKYGVDLNHELMTRRVYLTQRQALKAERRLADRLREQGFVVEGGK